MNIILDELLNQKSFIWNYEKFIHNLWFGKEEKINTNDLKEYLETVIILHEIIKKHRSYLDTKSRFSRKCCSRCFNFSKQRFPRIPSSLVAFYPAKALNCQKIARRFRTRLTFLGILQ